MSGWVKIHRKISEWEWYSEPNTLCLFIHLLIGANHKPKKWRGITINTGQIATGRKSLSDKTGLSEQKIRTALSNLQSTNEITIKSTKQYSLITITKWLDYQHDQPTKQPTINHKNNQQITTNKNEKKIRIDKPDSEYWFVKGVIKLDESDWEKWLKMFPNISDNGMTQLLIDRGSWLIENPKEQVNWFMRTQQYLSSVNKRGG